MSRIACCCLTNTYPYGAQCRETEGFYYDDRDCGSSYGTICGSGGSYAGPAPCTSEKCGTRACCTAAHDCTLSLADCAFAGYVHAGYGLCGNQTCWDTCCDANNQCSKKKFCGSGEKTLPRGTSCFPYNPCQFTGCMTCDWCCNMAPETCEKVWNGTVQSVPCERIPKPWFSPVPCYDARAILAPSRFFRRNFEPQTEQEEAGGEGTSDQCEDRCTIKLGDVRINQATGYAQAEFCSNTCACMTDVDSIELSGCSGFGNGCHAISVANTVIRNDKTSFDYSYRGGGSFRPIPCNN